jgi:hypothetical protein
LKISQEGKNSQETREFVESLWQARLDKKRTYQEISDETQIPYHTVCRFFQGTMDDPGIYIVNELAHALDVPMFAPDAPDTTAEVERLESELCHKDELLAEKDRAIGRLVDRSRIMLTGIEFRENRLAEKENELHTVQDGSKPLVYGLLGLCVMLAAVLLVYMILDARDPYQGLIRVGEGRVSVVVLLGILGVTVAVLVLIYMAGAHRFVHRKNKGES